ncbi:MAG: hypothetical protein IPI83_03180 [Sphingomonadales bacterium]|nr:hypothetical protein [Sphingomonadales bacterium]
MQTALAANLPKTGTYMVPDPSTQSGTTLYGKGPVAMVHYNSNGFPLRTQARSSTDSSRNLLSA